MLAAPVPRYPGLRALDVVAAAVIGLGGALGGLAAVELFHAAARWLRRVPTIVVRLPSPDWPSA